MTDDDDTDLLVEIWNENTALDDLVGQTQIPLAGQDFPDFSAGIRHWYNLEPEGRIDMTITAMVVVSDLNVRLGMQVKRGPHWCFGNQDSGHLASIGEQAFANSGLHGTLVMPNALREAHCGPLPVLLFHCQASG